MCLFSFIRCIFLFLPLMYDLYLDYLFVVLYLILPWVSILILCFNHYPTHPGIEMVRSVDLSFVHPTGRSVQPISEILRQGSADSSIAFLGEPRLEAHEVSWCRMGA